MAKNWTTWFGSDYHFGHDNVIDFCDRPFKDKEEMKEAMIANHNKVVSPEDLVIYVGDMFFYHSMAEMKEVMDRMNGRKILVKGNHDRKARDMMRSGFELCVDEMVMTIAGEKVQISHYPFGAPQWKWKWMVFKNKCVRRVGEFLHKLRLDFGKWGKRRVWPYKYHDKRPKNVGQFLIHGHTHDKEKLRGRAIHVGVDAWDFKPINIQEISNLIARVKEAEKKGETLRF